LCNNTAQTNVSNNSRNPSEQHLHDKAGLTSWFELCLSVGLCWSDSDGNTPVLSSTLTSTVSCSPSWIVHPNTRADGVRLINSTTQKQCLDSCANDSSCHSVSVDWHDGDNVRCYMQDDQNLTRHRSDSATLFEIVRKCYAESSTQRRRFCTKLFS